MYSKNNSRHLYARCSILYHAKNKNFSLDIWSARHTILSSLEGLLGLWRPGWGRKVVWGWWKGERILYRFKSMGFELFVTGFDIILHPMFGLCSIVHHNLFFLIISTKGFETHLRDFEINPPMQFIWLCMGLSDLI